MKKSLDDLWLEIEDLDQADKKELLDRLIRFDLKTHVLDAPLSSTGTGTVREPYPETVPYGRIFTERDMRVAACVKWYELGRISQGRAAELSGLSRAEFIDELGKHKVSVFQVLPEELAGELLE